MFGEVGFDYDFIPYTAAVRAVDIAYREKISAEREAATKAYFESKAGIEFMKKLSAEREKRY